MNKKVGIYMRVSTLEQVSGISLEVQENEGIKWCNLNGYDYKLYCDRGISGSGTEKRKEYNDLLMDIGGGEIDIVYVRDLARLNRNNLESTKLRMICYERKVVLYENNVLYDFEKSEDVLIYDILNSVNEFNRKYTGNLSLISKKNKLKEGKYVYGSVLFGYEIIDGKFVQVEKEVEIIKFVYSQVLCNVSLSQVKKELNIKYGIGEFVRYGKKLKFSLGWISKLINNESYYSGKYKVKFANDDFEFELEKIVEEDYWRRVNNVWKYNFRKRTNIDVGKFGEIVYCSICYKRCNIFKQSKYISVKGGEKEYYYYVNCNNVKCKNYRKNVIDVRDIEVDFKIFLNNILDGERKLRIEEFKDKLNILYNLRKKSIDKVKVEDLIEEVEDKEVEIDRLKTLFIKQDIDEEEYEIEKNKRREDIELLKKKIDDLGNKIYDDKLIIRYLEEFDKLNEGYNDDDFIEKFVDKIYVRVVKRDWFERGRLIKYKVDWKVLGSLDKVGLKILMVCLLINFQSLTNKEKLVKRYFGCSFEFMVRNMVIEIEDILLYIKRF